MVAQGEVADSFVLPILGCRMSGVWSAGVTQFITRAFHLPNTTAKSTFCARVAAIHTPARQTVSNDAQQGLECPSSRDRSTFLLSERRCYCVSSNKQGYRSQCVNLDGNARCVVAHDAPTRSRPAPPRPQTINQRLMCYEVRWRNHRKEVEVLLHSPVLLG
jgi:hypothetical protein